MADEKIRLVLSTDGVQDIKALEERFEELAQSLGVSDYAFEKVTEQAEAAKTKIEAVAVVAENATQKIENLAQASTAAGNSIGTVNGTASTASTTVKDLANSMGQAAGAEVVGSKGAGGLSAAMKGLSTGGLAAAIGSVGRLAAGIGTGGLLAIALNEAKDYAIDYGLKLLELATDIEEKVEPKLGEVTSALNEQTTEVKRLREEYDKLIASEDTSFLNRSKLKNITEDLADAEKRLADEKAAQKAGKEADENVGVIETEKVKSQQQSYKERFVDTGEEKDLKKQLKMDLARSQPEISNADAEMAGVKDNWEFRDMYGELSADKQTGMAQHWLNRASADQKQDFRRSGKAKLQQQAEKEQEETVNDILSRLKNAKTIEEIDKAYQDLAAISPTQAKKLRDYHVQRIESEALDKEVEESSVKMKEQRSEREKGVAETRKEVRNMDKVFGAYNKLNNKANTDAERAQAKTDKQQASADKKEKTQAEKEEEKRQVIRDKVLEKTGITPEGLAVERQNAATGNSKQAQAARQKVAQTQEQTLLNRFQHDGMTAEQAKKTTDEIGKIGKDIVQTMLRTGQMDLTMFKQLHLTAKGQELQRQRAMQEMRAGIRQPGFQGGNQAR